jgi:D-3-phosphoglycerate dehydrogenase
MYKVQTLNKIDGEGLKLLPLDNYEIASEMSTPDAVILRSFKMHDMELPASLKAIARAGAGVNNIPIDKCTDQGIVVFNTPGANANAVKEMSIAALMLASRDITGGIEWCKTLADKGDEVPALVEAGKKNFGGNEIKGKTLAVVGMGAIGVLVSNAASALGMRVIGYDPFMSVPAALRLSRNVEMASGIETLLTQADFIALHLPQTAETKGFINADKIGVMKEGVKILNFARGGLVNSADLKVALESGKVGCYVTDFPDAETLQMKNIIPIPHLGASTQESETNCAVMGANQVKDFLENGNIINSVNFPMASMERGEGARLIVANKNVPNMVSQISTILADADVNIQNMLNKNRDEIAYNIIDVNDATISSDVEEALKAIEGVIMVRTINA